MLRLSTICSLFLLLFSISSSFAFDYTFESPDIIAAFEKAGDNAPELQKVIDHYTQSGDSLKLDATMFLIANMEQHSYATYRWFDTAGIDVTFDVLDFPNYDSLKIGIGQIEEKRGELDYEKDTLLYDLNQITADFLIDQVDYAFLAWQNKPWAKNFDFTQFCRYILPYRGSNEPLEKWRKYFYDKYAYITDSMQNANDPLEAAAIINDDIKTWFGFDPRFYLHPTDQGLSEMIENKLGRCEDMTNVTIYAMRANGLAVTSDYTPYWANSGNNHAWNAIVTAEGEVIPFMGAEASPGNYRLSGKVGKVYRKTYDQQKDNLVFQVPEGTEIPPWLKGKNYMDVTADYTDVADVGLLFYNIDTLENFIPYLCVFNSGEWKAIHWGEKGVIRLSGERRFKFSDMGTAVAYLPSTYIQKTIIPWATPFILINDSTRIELSADRINLTTTILHATTKRKLVMSTDGSEKAYFKNGKKYELFYWLDKPLFDKANPENNLKVGWNSLGKQTAHDEKPLVFENVPSGGLYWLVAEGSNKEERIFTIDKDGNQVWW